MSTTPSPSPAPNPQPKKRKSKPSALADVLREWESLLSAVADHAAELAPADPYRTALADSLEKIKQAKGIQELHGATKQMSTQTLKEILVEGKERAIRLRGSIRAALGPTTERLTQFGIPPLRRRALRHKQPVEAPPPAPAPQPEGPAAKAVRGTE